MGVCAGKQKRTVNESNRQRKGERRRLIGKGLEETPSKTTLYDLPIEMLDVILQKSYLHSILNLSAKPRDEDVVRGFISVDVCFNRRITRQRFKKAIWRYLRDFYEKTTKRAAFIRNNRNYILKTIQPSNELISSLLSLNCVTERQRDFIERQSSVRDKNAELLDIMRSFNVAKFSNFIKCLQQNNQSEVAKILSTGGVVVKVTVINCGGEIAETVFTQLIHQRMSDLRNRMDLKSHETKECVRQLMNKSIEILNSSQKRQTVVVWIWCRTQAALEHIQNLYESNQMKEVFFDPIPSSISILIRIERNQFKKTIVMCPISIKMNFTQRIDIRETEGVCGVTKLGNEIFCPCYLSFPASNVIRVFEDRNPFRFRRKIKIRQIKFPFDIGSSEKENCLYVSDFVGSCIWKLTKERGDGYEIKKWLATDREPYAISVSIDGNLLMVNESSPILTIYGSDAVFIRSIRLPTDMEKPIHAVETSMGNFIILHLRKEKAEHWSEVRDRENWGVIELARDGQEVIRRFIPANKEQELNMPCYISLDSDDRVFVADEYNDRVILLDSDLQWNQNIKCCPSEEESQAEIRMPARLCYDKEKKQLIVVEYLREVTIYTLSQN